MYQLYAYGTKYEKSTQLYLIYPEAQELSLDRYSYVKDELHLDVVFFDLAKGFNQELIALEDLK
jgi:5-methylcytosine-specific restriction endonuclease McrBC regulatory subunit McrC